MSVLWGSYAYQRDILSSMWEITKIGSDVPFWFYDLRFSGQCASFFFARAKVTVVGQQHALIFQTYLLSSDDPLSESVHLSWRREPLWIARELEAFKMYCKKC